MSDAGTRPFLAWVETLDTDQHVCLIKMQKIYGDAINQIAEVARSRPDGHWLAMMLMQEHYRAQGEIEERFKALRAQIVDDG